MHMLHIFFREFFGADYTRVIAAAVWSDGPVERGLVLRMLPVRHGPWGHQSLPTALSADTVTSTGGRLDSDPGTNHRESNLPHCRSA
jgi:hypothetical protein